MSPINHPIQTGVAVSPSFAAIAAAPPSGSRCWPPAVASLLSACVVIASTPLRDRRG
jgi:hypothetical protein